MLVRNTFSSTFVIVVLAIGFISGALAAPVGPVVGTVTLVLGDVTGTDQDGDTFEVTRGADLHAGYSFDTGSRSIVRAEMNDGTRLTLSPNSSASVDSFSFDQVASFGGFTATVKRGGFRYVSGRLGSFSAAAVHSQISTPSGVIGVRGTIIEAVMGPNGLVISVPEGNVDFTFTQPTGATQSLTIGSEGSVLIAEITIAGVPTPMNELPDDVRAAIELMVQLINEAEQQSSQKGGKKQNLDQDGENEEDADERELPPYQFDTDTGTLSGGGVSPSASAPVN